MYDPNDDTDVPSGTTDGAQMGFAFMMPVTPAALHGAFLTQ